MQKLLPELTFFQINYKTHHTIITKSNKRFFTQQSMYQIAYKKQDIAELLCQKQPD